MISLVNNYRLHLIPSEKDKRKEEHGALALNASMTSRNLPNSLRLVSSCIKGGSLL